MKNKLVLDINDFGPINNAQVELNKINIIAGNNASGKSTSSKLLFCFLTAISKEGIYLANRSIYDNIFNFILEWNVKVNNKFAHINFPKDSLYNKYLNDSFLELTTNLEKIILNEDFPRKNSCLDNLHQINHLIELNKNDDERIQRVIKSLLAKEFNSEIKKVKNTMIKFYGNFENCEFSHDINLKGIFGANIHNKGKLNCLPFENIIYIDSPSIFEIPDQKSAISFLFEEENNKFNLTYHVEYLLKLLKKKKRSLDVYEVSNKKIEDVKQKIDELIQGNIYFDEVESTFKFNTATNSYSMKNTASGIKQFGIILLLLKNEQLKENSFLIIDEPEVNLHPEWQIKLAEILVLLAKETNIYFYINSHSPHFIEALEVFSAREGLVDESKFYLSEESEDNKFSFNEIKRKNLHILYDNLGKPYDEIDKVRMENVFNGIY